MSPTVIALLGIGAGVLTIAIHWLFRGARKTLEVATLEPFGDLVRPRLRLTRLYEPLLLLVRLLLLSLVIVVLLTSLIDFERARFGDQVVLVTPNTSTEVALSIAASGVDVRWLDADLTPVSQSPVSADWVQALLDADRKIPLSSGIRVTGWATARDWPVRSPVLRRVIEWDWIAQERMPTFEAWPERLQLLVDTDEHRSMLEQVIVVWRNYGLLGETDVRWIEPGAVSAEHPVIWWRGGSMPTIPFGVLVADLPTSVGAGWEVVAPPTPGEGVKFASRLWSALIAFESARPVHAMPARLSAEINPDLQPLSASPSREVAGLSGAWWLIALLFGVERLLAAQAGRR